MAHNRPIRSESELMTIPVVDRQLHIDIMRLANKQSQREGEWYCDRILGSIWFVGQPKPVSTSTFGPYLVAYINQAWFQSSVFGLLAYVGGITSSFPSGEPSVSYLLFFFLPPRDPLLFSCCSLPWRDPPFFWAPPSGLLLGWWASTGCSSLRTRTEVNVVVLLRGSAKLRQTNQIE